MANENKFQIKRTSTTGRTPNTTNSANSRYIDAGELALNLTDGKMFSSNGSVAFEIGSNVNTITVNKIVANGSLGNTASSVLLADSTGNVYWGSVEAAQQPENAPAQYKYFRYTASNNQTSFSGADLNGNTLLYAVRYESTYLNGIKLIPSLEYTSNTGTSIVLEDGTANNDILEIESFAGVSGDVVLTYGLISSNTRTTNSQSQVSCDSYDIALYRTAKYVIQIVDNTNLDYHAADAMVTHNGTSAYIATYGEVYSNVSLGTFDADIDTGYVRLLVTPITSNSTIKIIRQTMVI